MKMIANIVALIAIFALGWCGRGWLAPPPSTYEVTAIVRDTVVRVVEVDFPVVRYVERPGDTVYRSVDTAAILEDYFLVCYYEDTLVDDTSALVVLNDVVTQNKLKSRRLTFQNRRATSISTTVVSPDRRGLAWSVGFMAGRDLLAPVASVGWRRWEVTAGYNLQVGGVVVGLDYSF
jgi:hypothetical protein